mmetsp:Transcript_1384/g.1884  ORF Transcript_1384/g.1884 Transcript_1384/m.1884 type:complete len:193 (+) Transcript_1384:146-724(+)
MSNIISIVEEIKAELKKPPDEQNEKLILFLKELKQEKQKQEERRRLYNKLEEHLSKPQLEREKEKDLIQFLKDEINRIDNIGRVQKEKKSEINICGQDDFSSVISHLSQCFFGGYFSSRLASSSSTSFTQEMFLEPPRIPWIGSLSNKIPLPYMEAHPSHLVKDGLSSSPVGDDSSAFSHRGGIQQSLRRRK